MAKNIRTLVAALAIPLAFSAGAAHAYNSACADSLTTAAAQITNAGNYVLTKSWTINRDALMTKLAGIDGKLAEYPPKTGDALMIVSDMLQKVSDWVEAAKPKLKVDGAENIRHVLSDMNPDVTPDSVTECIGKL